VEQERYPTGAELMVIYPPKHPEQARVLSENEGWIGPIMAAMFGIGFLVFGIVLTSFTGWIRISRRTPEAAM
jgi:hypothetical protein